MNAEIKIDSKSQARLDHWKRVARALAMRLPSVVVEEDFHLVSAGIGAVMDLRGTINVKERTKPGSDAAPRPLLLVQPGMGTGYLMVNLRASSFDRRGPRKEVNRIRDEFLKTTVSRIEDRVSKIKAHLVTRERHLEIIRETEEKRQRNWNTKKAAIELALKDRPDMFQFVDSDSRGAAAVRLQGIEAPAKINSDSGTYSVHLQDAGDDYGVRYSSDHRSHTSGRFSGRFSVESPASDIKALFLQFRVLVSMDYYLNGKSKVAR